MDHLPRFRRRNTAPTIPAIFSPVFSSSPPSSSVVPPAPHQPQKQPPPPQQQQLLSVPNSSGVNIVYPSPPLPPPTPPTPHSCSSSLKSTLRTLRLKRARSPQMAQPAPSPVAIVHHESSRALEDGGVLLQSPVLPGESEVAAAVAVPEVAAPAKKRRIPYFLNQSPEDLSWKFRGLQCAESERNALADMSADPNHKWAIFNLGRTRKSNYMDRYSNIKPWMWNRVRLQVPAGTLDYVNASTITVQSASPPLASSPLRYIAMQGPTPASLDFVWRMVAEQAKSGSDGGDGVDGVDDMDGGDGSDGGSSPSPGPVVIVQLTRFTENGVSKCFPYLPSRLDGGPWKLNENDKWGDGWEATLELDGSVALEAGAIIKTRLLLHIRGEAEPRVVWHLLYRRWPDFGVPAGSDVASFFALMRLSQQLNSADNRRIIHCSAGVGRTGTFITLEHMVRELECGALESVDEPAPHRHGSGKSQAGSHINFSNYADNLSNCGIIGGGGESLSPSAPPSPSPSPPPSAIVDPICDTVDVLREQRRQMVQAEAQFVFIYSVLRRLWLEKYWGWPTGPSEGDEPAPKRLPVEDPFVE